MVNNHAIRDHIQRERKVTEDWKDSEVYDETKNRVACYMAVASHKWIRVAWRNERRKEQISLKKEAEKVIKWVGGTASFDEKVELLVKKVSLNGKKDETTEKYFEWKTRDE